MQARTAIEGVGVATQPTPPRAAPTGLNHGDRVYAGVLTALGGFILLLLGAIVIVCTQLALPAFSKIGFLRYLGGSDWNPVEDSFGALPFIYGTVVTSLVAIAFAMPVGVGLSLFLTEMAPKWMRAATSFLVELLAGVPSVVFGLWGLFVMVPLLRTYVEPFLGSFLGWTPLFSGPPLGLGYLAAGLILAVMILPTIASVSTAVLRTVPLPLKEGAYALGATKWEAIRISVLPFARTGILGAIILGLSRALGETMAVTMVIGNQPEIHASLFAAGYSLPSVIANEFAEATNAVHTGALAGLALVLLGVTLLLNSLARLLVSMSSRLPGAK